MYPSPVFYEALTEALVTEPADLPTGVHRNAIATAAVFAREQVNALNAELRWPMMIGLTGFQMVVGLRHFRSFARLPLERRRQVLRAWAFGPTLTRQLFRPIRATALVAYYEAVTFAAGRP